MNISRKKVPCRYSFRLEMQREKHRITGNTNNIGDKKCFSECVNAKKRAYQEKLNTYVFYVLLFLFT